MNAARRKRLSIAKRRLKDVCCILREVRDTVSSICEEEDEARDNMPENLTYSERYEKSEECSEAMEDAIESIGDAISSIESAI